MIVGRKPHCLVCGKLIPNRNNALRRRENVMCQECQSIMATCQCGNTYPLYDCRGRSRRFCSMACTCLFTDEGKRRSERFSKVAKRLWQNEEFRKSRIRENHNHWKGGAWLYPGEFHTKLREEIRERDGHTCCNPRCSKESDVLHVHHIDGDKKNLDPSNLITLCSTCHLRLHFYSRGQQLLSPEQFFTMEQSSLPLSRQAHSARKERRLKAHKA